LVKLQFANSGLSNSEMLRKVIHISGFLIPLFYVQFLSTYLVSVGLFLIIVVYTISEVARGHEINFPVFSTVTRKAAKSVFEVKYFATAPIAFTLGIILSLLFFPPSIAYASITVLTLGDSMANIFGKVFGKIPLPFNRKKTFEGTICGFVCAFFGSILFVNPLNALVAVIVGMLVESLPLQIDDNLAIPLSAGVVLLFISVL
jgi:dolichol kinase